LLLAWGLPEYKCRRFIELDDSVRTATCFFTNRSRYTYFYILFITFVYLLLLVIKRLKLNTQFRW
jgi:hypothetical protein